MSETVQVEVAGRSYRLRSDEGGADLAAVARLVNERIGDVLRAAPHLEKEEVAILAALNMGDELLRQRAVGDADSGDIEEAVEAVRSRIADLTKRLEQTVAPRD
ncbi:MAG: cell division protein ZapA [Acidobacteriota bacterium]|nr:cell division protein ZapA [Acidobacteriota bacterium]MXW71298.1 cell division protein ZapA [Acidobacteriota bacterium]MXX85596.1 cell division protein ZapA [Acidobacteriota bacterium]MYE43394.1 cell division protein ZapA [Acidobacteriota bacterium]MYF75786.1 cell division protein ZapA [Acidobacteriota bacterium]